KIITSMIEEDDLVNDMVQYLIVLYVLLIVSILVLNNLLLKKIWKPFYHSIAQLKNFKIEKQDSITTLPSNIAEFELLNKTVNKLIKKTSDTYIEQKQFIENAAHELQTPLAIGINKLELFLENNELTDHQAQELTAILDNLGRLTRLNKSLLLLSKIENKQFPDEKLIDFTTMTEAIVADFEDLSYHKSISISIETMESLTYYMNTDLANILLTNLIKNALVHGNNNASISIIVDTNLWTISNTGSKEMLDRVNLFSRFKKTTNKQSTGLGLAIAHAIATKYNLMLTYDFDGSHLFSIHFPNKG